MIPFQNAFRLGIAAATIVALGACSAGEAGHDHAGEEGASHTHSAKFGGTLVELGNHFASIELTHDATAGTVKLYTYDGHAETSQRSTTAAPVLTIKPEDGGAEFTVTLAPRVSKTSGESVGDSSLFDGQHESLKGLDHFEAVLAEITLKGKTFKAVEFLPSAGDHDGEEGHDHEEGQGHDEDGDDHEEGDEDHKGHDQDDSDG